MAGAGPAAFTAAFNKPDLTLMDANLFPQLGLRPTSHCSGGPELFACNEFLPDGRHCLISLIPEINISKNILRHRSAAARYLYLLAQKSLLDGSPAATAF
jgi:hypothetical protein